MTHLTDIGVSSDMMRTVTVASSEVLSREHAWPKLLSKGLAKMLVNLDSTTLVTA